MNMIRAGGTVPTTGSDVSSVASAMPDLQFLLVGVCSEMLFQHLQHSEACQVSSVL